MPKNVVVEAMEEAADRVHARLAGLEHAESVPHAPAVAEAEVGRRKRQGAGQVVAKGKNKWLVRVFKGWGTNSKGKPGRIYVSELVHGGKKDAQNRLNELLKDKTDGALTIKPKVSVAEFLDTWLEITVKPSRRVRTYVEYERVVSNYIKPTIGQAKLKNLDPMGVSAMVVKLRERGLAPRTVRMAHEVLRNALETAVTAKFLRDNPARSRLVKDALPQKVRNEPATISADDVAGFLDVAKDDRLAAFWTLQLLAGLRPSESLALRWSDLVGNTISVTRVLVDRAGPLHFAPPKSKTSRRAVVVPEIVVTALRDHRKRQLEERLKAGENWEDGDLVFCDELGQPLRQDHIRWVFSRLVKAAELSPKLTPYSLRHSCATLLLEKGVALKIVSERLGHSTIALTADVYSHVSQSMQQQAADTLQQIAVGKPG